MKPGRSLLLLAIAVFLPAVAEAKAFRVGLPVDCDPGKNCFVQNYFDHAPQGEDPHDYTCGHLTNSGHQGTDFRVTHEGVLNTPDGVWILSAADGVVERVFTSSAATSPLVRLIQNAGPEQPCGTGVQIQHPGNWTTRYCHMKPGSVLVKAGERVEAGHILGQMGMSGHTEFPHVHFEVQQYGKAIDPFVGYANGFDCREPERFPLWDKEAGERLSYQAGGVLVGGFTSAELTVEGVRRGDYNESAIPSGTARQLVFWVELFGVRQGDRLSLVIIGPDGGAVASRDETYDVNAALVLQVVTAQRSEASAWRKGRYKGYLSLMRNDENYISREWSVELEE